MINLSVALQGASPRGERRLQEAFDFALRRGVIVVAAATRAPSAAQSLLGIPGSYQSSPMTSGDAQWIFPILVPRLEGVDWERLEKRSPAWGRQQSR